MSEQAPVAAPRARLVAHAVLAGVGLVAVAISLRLGLWRQSSPGEGLFPFLTALAMVTFSVAALVRDWIRREPARPRAAWRPHRAHPGRRLPRRARVLCGLARISRLHRRDRHHHHLHSALRRALSLGRDARVDRRHHHRLPGAVRALARRHAADRNAVDGCVAVIVAAKSRSAVPDAVRRERTKRARCSRLPLTLNQSGESMTGGATSSPPPLAP